jgi:hypothetical protein
LSPSTAKTWIEVVNEYRWILDPRLASFCVYVDGKRAGAAPLHGSLKIPVASGQHAVRVRLWWWYASPRLVVDASPGQGLTLRADIMRTGSFTARMVHGFFKPFSSLALGPLGETAGP